MLHRLWRINCRSPCSMKYECILTTYVMKKMKKIRNVILGILLLPVAFVACAQTLKPLVISAPGPRNISYLPVDLIPKIGADTELGYKLQILHTGGGAVALSNLINRNADFAVAGVPAAMSLRANGGDVVLIAPVNDAPLFVLMVRADLKNRIKRIADLKGKVLGVNTSTKDSKTTSQQLAELLLKSGKVGIDQVRLVPAGQSWVEQSSLILTGSVDAVMGDEPFASRLLADQKVFFLANLADPKTIVGIKGAGFLHAALETRGDMIQKDPATIQKMVEMLRKTLQWMAQHSAEDIVAKLEVTDAQERASLLYALNRYPNAFSKDGKFSAAQLRETDAFFAAGTEDASKIVKVQSMTDKRWAGFKP